MFEKIAEGIVNRLSDCEMISEDERSIYQYGLESLLIKGIHTLTMVMIGWVMGLLPETLVFLTAYSLIRVYAGGYHANSRLVCYFWSWGTILGVLLIIKFSPENLISALIIILLAFGFSTIYFLAPVENSNKSLDRAEIKYYGKRARMILSLLTATALFLGLIDGCSLYGLAIALCLSLEGAMLILGKQKLKNKVDY